MAGQPGLHGLSGLRFHLHIAGAPEFSHTPGSSRGLYYCKSGALHGKDFVDIGSPLRDSAGI